MSSSLLSLKNELENDGVLVSFSGMFSHTILRAIAETMESKLEDEGVDRKIIKSLFTIFVEMAQNLISYSSDRKESGSIFESLGVIIIGFDGTQKKFYVKSGNNILKEKQEVISERINKVRNMDQDELKSYYRELRKSGKDTHDRGAGLGFAEIQRKATAPIEFNIHEIDDEKRFFELTVLI